MARGARARWPIVTAQVQVELGVRVRVRVRARVKGLGLGVGWVAPSGFAAAAACRGTTLEGVAARSPHMALIKAYCSAGEAWAGSGLAVRARARVSG